ncbi:DNA-binding response regulator [Enterococcus rotai]|uniref:DNA-binding response regulator n=1 Tax=Enterococcus rotai TaxID=118060 RepID=UPI0035C72FB6
MCNIGMLALRNASKNRIEIEEIKQKHTVIEITENLELLETIHAVVIVEEDIKDLSIICELISKIRNRSTCYIWIMTDTEHSVGKLVYLQLGADEVFDLSREAKEVVFIMENSLLRVGQNGVEESIASENHAIELLKLIPTNASVIIEGTKEVVLTKLEFQLLELLLRYQGMAVSYEMIYQEMWKIDTGENKQYRIANVIYHLRRKIEKDVKKPRFIKTVRSKGYMLNS